MRELRMIFSKTVGNLIEFCIAFAIFKLILIILGIGNVSRQYIIELLIVGVFEFAIPILLIRLVIWYYKKLQDEEDDVLFPIGFWLFVGTPAYILTAIIYGDSAVQVVIRFLLG